MLLQRQSSREMRPVAFASRSMTETECCYAQIEKEALATTWVLEHWSDLLIGMTFKVETNYKPLVPLLSTKFLYELPVRIQRFRMRLMRCTFSIDHVQGKHMYTADALSRAHTGDQRTQEFHQEVYNYVNVIMLHLPASEQRLE